MILLKEEQIEAITAKALKEHPHWEVDAWGLFAEVAKEQLKRIVEWGDEECPDYSNDIISIKRRECSACWQALSEEVK